MKAKPTPAMASILTVGELADYLRVHSTTVYRLLRQGSLPAFKVGSDWRFSLEAIDKWIQNGSAMEDAPTTARVKRA